MIERCVRLREGSYDKGSDGLLSVAKYQQSIIVVVVVAINEDNKVKSFNDGDILRVAAKLSYCKLRYYRVAQVTSSRRRLVVAVMKV